MKIAIVKLSAMGDIIHAMVALQYIKSYDSSIEIDWIVEEVFAPILEYNLHIDNILIVKLKAIKKDKLSIFKEIKRVREYAKNSYDLIIDAQGLLKSAFVSNLLGQNRVGFSKESIREGIASKFYNQMVEIDYDANTIDRNVKVLSEPLGLEISHQMIQDKEPFLFYDIENLTFVLPKNEINIIFVIGSTWESRNYPKEKFAQIADELKSKVWITWGNEAEYQKAKWIEEHSDFAKALPKLNLNNLKAIISQSSLLIGNDTGPTHLAWGLNIPSITIFGPTPINRVYQTNINKVVNSSSKVNHYKLNKEDYSIRDIETKDIIDIAKELLDD